MDNIMNRPERLSEVNQDKGLGEILTPAEYRNRGIKVIRAIEDAIHTIPRQDTPYPDWNIRYFNPGGGHGKDSVERLCFGAFRNILTDPKHPIDFEGYHWSDFNFHSKEYTNRGFDAVWPQFNCVCNVWVSAKVGTVIVQMSDTKTDLDIPGLDTPRLYNSELIYQAWRDAVTANVTGELPPVRIVSKLTDLKYIIRAPIGNSGTLATMRDVLLSQGVSKDQLESRVTVKRTFDDPSSDEFKILMGTVNGRPIGRLCADHAESLNGKQVQRIHVWNEFIPSFGALIFELGEEKALTELEQSTRQKGKSNTTQAPSQKPQPPRLLPAAPAKVTRKISERVKNLMKKFQE
ncbi:uncharacterized protein Bfra_007904 [Botrytis fragariae]|uniref:Uncharacterized protein n=1 Tax=Botrytis fragariae TaxID=1964551 RepID=A0A8H6AP59_9HELO|nr:uncharacterized protein Bfra_007904 [Botrytis fragariae]KAF5871388.1 hypothetical protein Bfra_007904 [Botrytis fragariae]